ncbi:MAG TPA: glycoside hydrolase family 32 protein [Thermomicrobiales bacterium]|nr:glycoside hydrolase family 32 protein [Thermomicrobiales bacterium]
MDFPDEAQGRVEQDRHRPRYHFLPPANWMNDPNGLIHYQGQYHLFYQYNPKGAFWGTMHWGHALSEDLVHWRHMPVALTPAIGGPDEDGCYSGAAVVHDGVPTLVYTGVRGTDQLPCLAMSEDQDLGKWRTFPGNPVIDETPSDVQTTIFRDHTLWREDGAWMMGIGAGIEGSGGAVLLYCSHDLIQWEYLHPLAIEDPTLNPGGRVLSTGWECPDFFFFGDRPALIACEWDGEPIAVSYWTGQYLRRRFTAHYKGAVDAGSSFYGPQSFMDESGRRIMFGWLREVRSESAQRDAGWSGAMTLPRIITMGEDGALAFAVVPEVEALRGRHYRLDVLNSDVDLRGVPGNSLEIQARFGAHGGGPVGLQVCCSPDGGEATTVLWDIETGILSLDTRQSSRDQEVTGELASAFLGLTEGEPLSLRVFVDRSVIEVYANQHIALSGRIYPSRQDSLGVRVVGPDALSGDIDLYEMKPMTTGL